MLVEKSIYQRAVDEAVDEANKIQVDVTSEKEQEKLYNDLTNKGYTCRILTL